MRQLFFALSLSAICSGCVTHWNVGEDHTSFVDGSGKAIEPIASIERGTAAPNQFEITNTSQGLVSISYRDSVAETGGMSYRLFSRIIKGTKRKNELLDAAEVTIAPGSSATVPCRSDQIAIESIAPELVTYRLAIHAEGRPTVFAIIKRQALDRDFTTTGVGSHDIEDVVSEKFGKDATAYRTYKTLKYEFPD